VCAQNGEWRHCDGCTEWRMECVHRMGNGDTVMGAQNGEWRHCDAQNRGWRAQNGDTVMRRIEDGDTDGCTEWGHCDAQNRGWRHCDGCTEWGHCDGCTEQNGDAVLRANEDTVLRAQNGERRHCAVCTEGLIDHQCTGSKRHHVSSNGC
jgi:hypothetical protein